MVVKQVDYSRPAGAHINKEFFRASTKNQLLQGVRGLTAASVQHAN